MANQGTALARALEKTRDQARSMVVTGAYHDANVLTEVLQKAAENYNLVAPATSCGELPLGFSVALSSVLVDTSKEAGEVYKVGDKQGLAKVVLDRVAAAAGVSWDPIRSRRLDDGSDPRYCAFQAVGSYKHFDGSIQVISATKEMDLRPGSPTIVGLEEKARRKTPPGDATSQIRELRMHILSHAETKARLRAIRALGIKTSYTDEELKKPFVIARMMFTGHTSDPALRQQFAILQAQSALNGSRSLYGDAVPMVALPAPMRPPPVGASIDDDIEEEPAPSPPRRAPSRVEQPVAEPAPEQPARRASAPAPQEHQGGEASGFKVPGGEEKGTPIEEASTETLRYWAGRIRKNLDDGVVEHRFEKHNRALVEAMKQELDFRAREGGG